MKPAPQPPGNYMSFDISTAQNNNSLLFYLGKFQDGHECYDIPPTGAGSRYALNLGQVGGWFLFDCLFVE